MTTMDLRNHTGELQALVPQTIASSTTVNGAAVPVFPHRWAKIVLNVGAIGATTTATVKVQRRTGASTWADITGALFTDFDANRDAGLYRGLIDLERVPFAAGIDHDIRVVVENTGTGGTPISGHVEFAGAPHTTQEYYDAMTYDFALTAANQP